MNIFMALLTILTSLYIAGIAAWFSVAGIVAIFAGSPVVFWGLTGAALMGIGIEVGKLVGVSWLYRNWDSETISKKFKYGLSAAVLTAVFLTSVGIFGYLSKSHLEQGAPVANNVAKMELIDNKIASRNEAVERFNKTIEYNKNNIERAETQLSVLDDQIAVLVKYAKISDEKDGSRAVTKEQQPERDRIDATIDKAQSAIDATQQKIDDTQEVILTLNEERLELGQVVRDFEVEVGPVKYIAAIIFSEGDEKTNLEKAVRMMIFIIMFAFDPLAILLLIAGNHTLMEWEKKRNPNEEEDDTPPPIETIPEPDIDELVSKMDDSSDDSVLSPPPPKNVTLDSSEFSRSEIERFVETKEEQKEIKAETDQVFNDLYKSKHSLRLQKPKHVDAEPVIEPEVIFNDLKVGAYNSSLPDSGQPAETHVVKTSYKK